MIGTLRRRVLFPNHYAWFVLLGSLDIMVTYKLLVHLGAREVNTIAQRSIELFGLWGLIGLKFASVIVVICICEHIGRRRERAGNLLAKAAIAISLLPITAAMVQIVILLLNNDLEFEPWPPTPEAQMLADPSFFR